MALNLVNMVNNNQHIQVPVQSVMRGVTLHVDVTGVRTWKVRLWLGTQVIRLAAWIMGCGVKIGELE